MASGANVAGTFLLVFELEERYADSVRASILSGYGFYSQLCGREVALPVFFAFSELAIGLVKVVLYRALPCSPVHYS